MNSGFRIGSCRRYGKAGVIRASGAPKGNERSTQKPGAYFESSLTGKAPPGGVRPDGADPSSVSGQWRPYFKFLLNAESPRRTAPKAILMALD